MSLEDILLAVLKRRRCWLSGMIGLAGLVGTEVGICGSWRMRRSINCFLQDKNWQH